MHFLHKLVYRNSNPIQLDRKSADFALLCYNASTSRKWQNAEWGTMKFGLEACTGKAGEKMRRLSAGAHLRREVREAVAGMLPLFAFFGVSMDNCERLAKNIRNLLSDHFYDGESRPNSPACRWEDSSDDRKKDEVEELKFIIKKVSNSVPVDSDGEKEEPFCEEWFFQNLRVAIVKALLAQNAGSTYDELDELYEDVGSHEKS